MTRSQFVRAVARSGYSTNAEVNDILRAMEGVIITTIGKGEDIKLFEGFKLASVFKDEHVVWDPRLQIYKTAPARYRCKLRTSKAFNERINYETDNGK